MAKSHIFMSQYRERQREIRRERQQRQKEQRKQKREQEREQRRIQKELEKYEKQEKRRRSQTWRGVSPGDSPEKLRQELRKLAHTVNRQARKLQEYTASQGDVENPALKELMQSGGFINPNVNDDNLYTEYLRALSFMQDSTHTIPGFEEYKKQLIGVNDAWRVVDKVAETVPRLKYDTAVRKYAHDHVVNAVQTNPMTFDDAVNDLQRNIDAIIRMVDEKRSKFSRGFSMG